MKNENILPILLLAGGALAFMAFRRRPRATVTADMPIRQTEEEFIRDQRAAVPPYGLNRATDVIKNIFVTAPQRKAATQAQRQAVMMARKKGQNVQAVKAVAQKLAKGQIRLRGFADQDVLC
jgi:hypothetical protein